MFKQKTKVKHLAALIVFMMIEINKLKIRIEKLYIKFTCKELSFGGTKTSDLKDTRAQKENQFRDDDRKSQSDRESDPEIE